MISPTDALALRAIYATERMFVWRCICTIDGEPLDEDGSWHLYAPDEPPWNKHVSPTDPCRCTRMALRHRKQAATAPLYLVTAEMAELAVRAGRTVPHAGRPDIMPSGSGFMIIDKPLGVDPDDSEDGLGGEAAESTEIPGVSWDSDGIEFATLTDSRNWVDHGCIPWGDLTDIPEEMQTENTVAGPAAHRPFIAAALLMQQKLAVAEPASVARWVRRQHARQNLPSAVKVIRWRRIDQRPRDDSEEAMVEWSHRWIVSGHWRNQWYPSFDAHLPIWISPHEKGPKDKPLVVRETVTVWSR